MPLGVSSTIKSETNKTQLPDIFHGLRIRLDTGQVLRYSNTRLTNKQLAGDDTTYTYQPRLMDISALAFDPNEETPVTFTLANLDGAITALDQTKSFAGAKVDWLMYVSSTDESVVRWSGWLDEIGQINNKRAVLTAYPNVATTRIVVPKRTIGQPCPWHFRKSAGWINYIEFDGAGCPYQRTGTIGFTTTVVDGGLDGTTDPISIRVNALADGQAFVIGDEIFIDLERFLIYDADVISAGKQFVEAHRAQKGTVKAAHSIGATVTFANCQKTVPACKRRGMYGNNTLDTVGGRKRNYFGGFPFLSGAEWGRFISKQGQKPKLTGIAFSGNESAYGKVPPIACGRCRVEPILLIAKGEGDFMTSLWAVSAGVLATNATDSTQTTPVDAYVGGATDTHFYVNGISRHDPRAGFGFDNYNGHQDQPPPGFFTGITDFSTNYLGFFGTAWVCIRINTKNSPSVDVSGQTITAAADLQYGQLFRVYTDPTTYTLKATSNPAWHLMHVLTSKMDGMGYDHAELNIQSFIDVAAHNDELVLDTFANDGVTMKKRWTFNGPITTQKSGKEWVHLICRGMSCTKPFPDANGKLKIKSLKSETLTGLPKFSSIAGIGARNIVPEDGVYLELTRKLIDESYNQVAASYVSLETGSEYTRTRIVIADQDAQEAVGVKRGNQAISAIAKDVDLPGCSTFDEAARRATRILRCGEYGEGGLSNNRGGSFKAAYRDTADLEAYDVIELEDPQLSAVEKYVRILRITDDPIRTEHGGLLFGKTITFALHNNAIYDDTALSVANFDLIDTPGPNDAEPPAVTGFSITEAGGFDGNNKPVSLLTFAYTEPSPKKNFKCVVILRSKDVAGAPDGKWDEVIQLFNPGTTFMYPVTNQTEWFAAVSRSLSDVVADVNTKLADGTNKYPRVTFLVDGMRDTTLAAPTGLAVVSRTESISLTWDEYDDSSPSKKKALLREYEVFRNTVNTSGTASKINGGVLRGTAYKDDSDTVKNNPSTTYYFWVRAIDINGVASAFSASANTTTGASTIGFYLGDVAPNGTFSNSVSPSISANADGSRDVLLQIDYAQGSVAATGFLVFFNSTGAAIAITDAAWAIDARPGSTTYKILVQGVNPSTAMSFGIVAFDVTKSGRSVTGLQAPASWQNISTATPNFTGNIDGSGATTVRTNAANGQTAFTDTAQYRNNTPPDNAPTSSALSSAFGPCSPLKKGTVSWNYSQGTNIATHFGIIVKRGGGTPTLSDQYNIIEANKTAYDLYLPPGLYSFGIFACAVTKGGITRNSTITTLTGQSTGNDLDLQATGQTAGFITLGGGDHAYSITVDSDMDLVSNNRDLLPRNTSASSEPTLASGTMRFWRDSVNHKVYLVYKDLNETQRKVELV